MSEEAFPPVVAIDCNFLVAFTAKDTTEDDRYRLNHFLERAAKTRSVVVVPMPAFAEYLVRAERAALPIVEELEHKRHVRLMPFDRMAAFECSGMTAAALGRGNKRDGSSDAWQKIKVDRQIVAIAKAAGARLIVSCDQDVQGNAARVGIHSCAIADLPLPAEALQRKLPLDTDDTPTV